MNLEALINLRTNLIKNKQTLKLQYDNSIKEIDQEIARISNTFKLIEDLLAPYKCTYCGGTGEISHLDAAGSLEYTTCSYCNGIGLIITNAGLSC